MGFQVLMQTNFTNPAVVYDSDAPAQPATGIDWSNIFTSVVNPVIQVEANGVPLYKTGDWYTPQGQWWLLGLGAVMLIGIATIAAKVSK